MKRHIIALLIVSAVLSAGCAGSGNIDKTTRAVHVSDAVGPDSYTLVYSIPKTTLDISVEVMQIITRRGPYYQFAERFLGISGVPSEDLTRWRIEDVDINSYNEADPEQYYLLSTNDRYVTNFFRLSNEGFIIPVNQSRLPATGTYFKGQERAPEQPLYTDLSIHPNVVEETRTVMRRERQDTTFVNVPVMQRQSVTRSMEAKAAEAADLIFELRNNRFKLLSGELDLFPDGRAMEVIIEEFARLEREYISLFTGKVIEINHVYKFEFSPDANALNNGQERRVLFRFSNTAGILPENDVSGRPVTIELQNEMKTAGMAILTPAPAVRGQNQNKLFYRVPDVAGVRLSDGNNTIVNKRVPVSQYGKVINIPADFLWLE